MWSIVEECSRCIWPVDLVSFEIVHTSSSRALIVHSNQKQFYLYYYLISCNKYIDVKVSYEIIANCQRGTVILKWNSKHW